MLEELISGYEKLESSMEAARLETLSDGSILMVMTENQDTVFDAIKDAVEAA